MFPTECLTSRLGFNPFAYELPQPYRQNQGQISITAVRSTLLKRGVIGSFDRISIKQLHRHLSESQFHWNNREAQDIFVLVIAALVTESALPYRKLTEALPAEEAGVDLDEQPF